MSEPLPAVYPAWYGETTWSLSGEHTGRTDLPLTERGESRARGLGERLRGLSLTKVLTSPLQRASSAHILRVFTARWLGLEAAAGRCMILGAASIGVLGHEHNLTEPVIR